MPDAPERERRPLVRGELETSGALPLGGGAFGHLWVKAPSEEEREESDVFAFYSDDAGVDAVREALRVANLKLDSIEPYSIAAIRAFMLSRETPEPVALLCPSDSHTDLCIHDGRQVRYLRRIAGGWEEMRYASRQQAFTSDEAAPVAAQPLGVDDALDEAAAAQAGVLGGIHDDHDSSNRAFLTAEVARSFAFYSREYKDADVPRSLVVLSPAQYAEDIARTIEPTMPIPVVCGDTAAKLELPEPTGGELGQLGFLAAAGAALGDVGSLLPRVDASRQEAAALSRRHAPDVLLFGMAGSSVWMIASVVAAVALSLLQSSAEVSNNLLKRDIEVEWARRAGPLRNEEVFNAARGAQTKVATAAPAVLAAVAQAHDGALAISSVKVDPGSKVAIEGTAVTPESMQAFAASLSQTHAVNNPSFDMMHQDNGGLYSFRIVGTCGHLTPEGALREGGG